MRFRACGQFSFPQRVQSTYIVECRVSTLGITITVNPIKLETGLRPNSAGIPYTFLLRIEAMGFPTFGLLLYGLGKYPP